MADQVLRDRNAKWHKFKIGTGVDIQEILKSDCT
jgi:hypothetical protein